ncbi:MAG: nucleotidyltransferase family protein [Thermoanaerobaculia bacterium]
MDRKALHKAVILARGLGTRMQRPGSGHLSREQEAAAGAGAKVMMPLAGGRPFLDYAVSALANAGFTDACLVVGPEHDGIRRYYREEAPPRRLRIAFATQQEPKGTADAVLAAEEFAGTDPFVLVNGDNLYPTAALVALRELDGPGLMGFSRQALVERGNVDAARVASFAVAVIDGSGRLARLVEKPAPEFLDAFPELPVSMNCWRFSTAIFEACRRVRPSSRGELELPDAVAVAIEELGESFRVIPCDEPVLDLGRREDVAAVEAALSGSTPEP